MLAVAAIVVRKFYLKNGSMYLTLAEHRSEAAPERQSLSRFYGDNGQPE
jgi:hypothetical protein